MAEGQAGRDDGVLAEAFVEAVDDRLQEQSVLAAAIERDLLRGAAADELVGSEGEPSYAGPLQGERVEDCDGDLAQVGGVGGGFAQGAGAFDPRAVGERDAQGEGFGGLVAAQPVAGGDGRVQQLGAQQVGIEGVASQEALFGDVEGRPVGITARRSMPRARSCSIRPARPPTMRCTVATGVAARAPTVCSP
ncbi:hypothetical protein OG607_00720 [Streptomyces sp. NBC_01537]